MVAHMDDLGTPALVQPLRDRLGARDGHAVPVDQAGGLALGRHAQRHDRLAGRTASRRGARSATSSPTCIDVAPTVLEAAGIPEPSTVNGVTQRPDEGTPMNYSFDDADAAGAAHHPVLRDARQPRDLPPRLDGRRQAQGSVARLRPRPRRRRVGALQRRGGLDAVERPRGRGTGASWPSCSGCSSSRQPASTCCRSTSARPNASTPTSPAGPSCSRARSQTLLPRHEAARARTPS